MRKYIVIFTCSAALFVNAGINLEAQKDVPLANRVRARAGDCVRGVAKEFLEVNNIRATLLNSGDLWWDRTNAGYEAPKRTQEQVDNKVRTLSPLFEGSIWISGKVGGNLRMAAIQYSGFGGAAAYWPGPIKQGDGTIEKDKCNRFDKFWKVRGSEISEAQKGGKIAQSILEWPGRGNTYLIKNGKYSAEDLADPLAPFYDQNSNCIYEPENGDLPSIKMANGNDFEKKQGCWDINCNNFFTYADEMIFWVMNDVGSDHVNPASTPISVQMNCLAFAFKSSDELNNMTFYSYDVWNKGNVDLEETYMSMYMDADLGGYEDDYVGCDTTRSLGYIYNADEYDEDASVQGYKSNVPIFGADFFEGPKKDNGVPVGLSSFVYFVKAQNQPLSDPATEIHFRNYQEGKSRLGLPLTVSADCITPGNLATRFCYYGDPTKSGEWSMCDVNAPKRDLRWAQNSGPFKMGSGQMEKVTMGLIFVQPPVGSQAGCKPAMRYLQEADDKAQRLFENCFQKTPGPDAPELKIIEASNKLHINIENLPSSNNYGENYDEKNIDIPITIWNKDTTYKFEGYAIYQILSENAVSGLADLKDNDKAKLIMIMDKKNIITKGVNYKNEDYNGQNITVVDFEYQLPNKGIEREFTIERDYFQFEGQSFLINNKTYYYAVVAFAYNNYINANPPFEKQKSQLYFSNSIKIFKGTPHNINFWGIKTKAEYYQGVPVTRKQGQGHGKYFLDFIPGEEQKILTNGAVSDLTYQGGKSPILVKVVDPFKVQNAKFKLTMIDSSPINIPNKFKLEGTYWSLEIKDTATRTIYSEGNLDRDFSQSVYARINNKLESYGIAIATTNPDTIGLIPRNGNKFYSYIGGSISFKDSSKNWLRLITDENGSPYKDWIRSGAVNDNSAKFASAYTVVNGRKVWTDSIQAFAKVLDGQFAPYCLAANANVLAIASENNYQSFSPGFKWRRVSPDSATMVTWGEGPENTLDSIFSVDLVITPDKTKWSKSVVFETGESELFTEGNAFKGQLRQATSVDKEGLPLGADKGLGYFPGYAINLETGVRMNVYFGENSRFRGKNAANMRWDPDTTTETVLGNPLYGGSQFIYIMNTPYDNENTAIQDAALLAANFNQFNGSGNARTLNPNVANFYRKIAWTCVPLTAKNFSLYNASGEYEIPTEVRIKIRVEKPYAKYQGDESVYEFSTEGLQPEKSDSLLSSAFDKMTVVPNPYYAFSSYELNATQNIVKIVNVPKNSIVSIFTTDGMLVRRLKLDPKGIVDGQYGDNSGNINYDNTIDWDLRTTTGVMVSSGVYYIHVEAPNLGSKVLKLFATMRAADVSNF
ncbi:MAG: hypothetical protein ACK5UE_02625 [Chitinophagales bacterium]|jgi:hypothetical protein|nr:hypothetical protein [Sphingobacteriales bacterium]